MALPKKGAACLVLSDTSECAVTNTDAFSTTELLFAEVLFFPRPPDVSIPPSPPSPACLRHAPPPRTRRRWWGRRLIRSTQGLSRSSDPMWDLSECFCLFVSSYCGYAISFCPIYVLLSVSPCLSPSIFSYLSLLCLSPVSLSLSLPLYPLSLSCPVVYFLSRSVRLDFS